MTYSSSDHDKTILIRIYVHQYKLEMGQYMIYTYQYNAFLISQYSDILHDTEQCVLVGFDRWT